MLGLGFLGEDFVPRGNLLLMVRVTHSRSEISCRIEETKQEVVRVRVRVKVEVRAEVGKGKGRVRGKE
jgi:hypothetical protein